MPGQSMFVSCWKRNHSFVCVIRAVIYSQGNFFGGKCWSLFCYSNDKQEYGFNTSIFISDLTFYYVSTQRYFFPYNNHETIIVRIIVPDNNIRQSLFTDSRNKLFSFILIIIILLTSIYDDNLSLIFSNATREFRPFQNGLRI